MTARKAVTLATLKVAPIVDADLRRKIAARAKEERDRGTPFARALSAILAMRSEHREALAAYLEEVAEQPRSLAHLIDALRMVEVSDTTTTLEEGLR